MNGPFRSNLSTILDADGGVVLRVSGTTFSNAAEQYRFVDFVVDALNTSLGSVVRCEACGGKGWLLSVESGPTLPKIVACDTCNRFEDDGDAVRYVANRASTVGS